jgi:hypothetical protein
MNEKYKNYLIGLANEGDKGSIEALKRAGVEVDAEPITTYEEVEYDKSEFRIKEKAKQHEVVLPDWVQMRKDT